MKDFIYGCDVPVPIYDRIHKTDNYELYIADCFWVLVIDGHYEFYYNPELFMGKVKKDEMPAIVKERIRRRCVDAKRLPGGRAEHLTPTYKRMAHFEGNMKIGNWFHAQGQNYITNRGCFIADDMYVPNCERECPLSAITSGIVDDMLRMGVQTRTPHYIRSIFELDVFQGIAPGTINILPFENKNWSAEAWRKEFEHYVRYHDFTLVKKLRAEVFQDTILRVKLGQYISENGRHVQLPSDERMIGQTEFYRTEIHTDDSKSGRYETKVQVLNEDTLIAAKQLLDEGLHPAVLNMASRQNPGGGVYGGAGAQEENLFRRTNLFRSMFQFAPYAAEYGLKKSVDQYPLDRNWGGVYTPQACVFRGTEADGYPLLDEPYFTDFIAVPAVNAPELDADGMIVPVLAEATKRKMRTIFRIAATKGNDSLVLGALGCGAFRNPPRHVARLFREVMEEDEFKGVFKKIVFAILDDHNAHKGHNPEGNFKPFEEVFKDFGKKADVVEMPQDAVKFLERSINWILPGCQLFYRDTDADVDVEKAYPIGSIIRAGFFIDVTEKAQRPVTKLRYIIASAHCAKLWEAMNNEDTKRWRLCTLHFNSYFKVMDVYEKEGVTQVFLLHIPYRAVPFFRADHSFNFIQGVSQMNLVEIARKSLDAKLQMDVFAETTEPDLLQRMHQPVGLNSQGSPVSMEFMAAPPHIEALSKAVRQLGEDMDEINYPEGCMQ